MKLLIFAFAMLLVASAQASNKSLFSAMAAASGSASNMGGKSFTVIEDLKCQSSNDTKNVTCKLTNTNGEKVTVSGKVAKTLLAELMKAGATSYAGAGAGHSWSETKQVQCLRAREYSIQGAPLDSFTYECSVHLNLYGI